MRQVAAVDVADQIGHAKSEGFADPQHAGVDALT
jgi:hypothetical protein